MECMAVGEFWVECRIALLFVSPLLAYATKIGDTATEAIRTLYSFTYPMSLSSNMRHLHHFLTTSIPPFHFMIIGLCRTPGDAFRTELPSPALGMNTPEYQYKNEARRICAHATHSTYCHMVLYLSTSVHIQSNMTSTGTDVLRKGLAQGSLHANACCDILYLWVLSYQGMAIYGLRPGEQSIYQKLGFDQDPRTSCFP
ncbi:uncharacterized protein EV420DRAFT_503257 [Desarmillaria tabescens]|uniref:Uncharacterized protein n=1 Tax=Armillaria tabescens TaxID=1929756 RepID=A0AA39KAM9_ARMTA|nr:uncharacterized protein EV420DRAFT_503257 [Desarmillaria tabescens]KAK0457585.1 hypothetical protein EV420DRAFT_503257 [Desarmillaria tabescens]